MNSKEMACLDRISKAFASCGGGRATILGVLENIA